MFRFTLICVGKLKSSAITSMVTAYQERIQRNGKIESITVPDSTIESESQRILEHLSKRNHAKVFVLAEEGQSMSSKAFSKELEALRGQHAIFVIGGAYGLSDSVKQSADVLLSLSKMTVTHELAQLLLNEQLFRAVSIMTGSKYHHD